MVSADAPRTPAAPPPVVDGSEWLVEQLRTRGAEKPSAHLIADKGTWVCRDGNRVLGRIRHADVEARDEDAVQALWGHLTAVVAMRIVDAPWQTLWSVSLCSRHVQQGITRGFDRGEVVKIDGPGGSLANRAYHRGTELAREWQAEQASWAKRAKDVTQRERASSRAGVRVGSSIIVAASKRVCDLYQQWLKNPTEKDRPWPVAVGFNLGAAHLDLIAPEDGDHLFARLRVLGESDDGSRQEQPVVKLVPRGHSAVAICKRLLSGEYAQRGCRVLRDSAGHWMLHITYHRPKPAEVVGGTGALIVRRSLSNFLVVLGTDGVRPGNERPDNAQNIIGIKLQMSARRSVARRHLEHQGRGARGHGRARFYRLLSHMQDAEARFVKTWCQQQAAFAVRSAMAGGYSEILLENFVTSRPPQHLDKRVRSLLRRFPFGILRQSIEWAGAKAGLSVRPVTAHGELTCPKCETPMVRTDWSARCPHPDCDCAGDPDTIMCWLLARHAGYDCAGLELRAANETRRIKAVRAAKERERFGGGNGVDKQSRTVATPEIEA